MNKMKRILQWIELYYEMNFKKKKKKKKKFFLFTKLMVRIKNTFY